MTQHPTPVTRRTVARRMYELVEPLGLVPYTADEPNEALAALGLPTYWDTYFAGRAAPFGRDVPAEVVHAVFYNFALHEVARHIPSVWDVTTPAAALEARERGCVAGLRALPVPEEPVARLWHAATLLREHRGDGHVVALMAEGIGGIEAHLLQARVLGVTDEQYGRAAHLPLAPLLAGLQERGLLDADGGVTDAGRAARDRVEAMTDRLAEAPYDALTPAELEQLAADLAPLAAPIKAHLPW